MKNPVDHVARPSLPWRPVSPVTECGRPVNDVAQVISRDDLAAKLREQGKQRAAMSTCMTCMGNSEEWATWNQDPVQAVTRETYGTRMRPTSGPDDLFRRELLALGELVSRHRTEFEVILEGLGQVVPLANRRRKTR
jgi:hypothetical protein